MVRLILLTCFVFCTYLLPAQLDSTKLDDLGKRIHKALRTGKSKHIRAAHFSEEQMTEKMIRVAEEYLRMDKRYNRMVDEQFLIERDTIIARAYRIVEGDNRTGIPKLRATIIDAGVSLKKSKLVSTSFRDNGTRAGIHQFDLYLVIASEGKHYKIKVKDCNEIYGDMSSSGMAVWKGAVSD